MKLYFYSNSYIVLHCSIFFIFIHILFIPDPVCRTIPYYGNSTNPNPDPGQKCIFPFTHNQQTFTKCIRTIDDKNFWCGTDSDESKIRHENKWGICNEMCEKQIGRLTEYTF